MVVGYLAGGSVKGEWQETTLVFDYEEQTVEFWTTKRSLFLGLIARNPSFLVAEELKPGYRIVYPIAEVRRPKLMVRNTMGGEERLLGFLTPSEVQNRNQRRESAKVRFAPK